LWSHTLWATLFAWITSFSSWFHQVVTFLTLFAITIRLRSHIRAADEATAALNNWQSTSAYAIPDFLRRRTIRCLQKGMPHLTVYFRQGRKSMNDSWPKQSLYQVHLCTSVSDKSVHDAQCVVSSQLKQERSVIIWGTCSAPSKKILHRANVCFVAHETHVTAQPCRHTKSEGFPTPKNYAIYI